MTGEVEIRAMTAADREELKSLGWNMGVPTRYDERWTWQERNEAVQLIAIEDGEIVGQVLVRFDGPVHEDLRLAVPPCGEVEEFAVRGDRQRRGIGSRLLREAEKRTAGHGLTHIGLAVGLENPNARSLYEHRGYVLVPWSEHRVTWPAVEPDGRLVTHGEDCVYLVKALTSR